MAGQDRAGVGQGRAEQDREDRAWQSRAVQDRTGHGKKIQNLICIQSKTYSMTWQGRAGQGRADRSIGWSIDR